MFRIFTKIGSLLVCFLLTWQLIAQESRIQELRGTGSIPFFFRTWNQIKNGVSLGSQAQAYTVLRISFKDTRPTATGWQLSLQADREFEVAYGEQPASHQGVQLSDLKVYVGIGETSPTHWEATPFTPNNSAQVIISGTQTTIQDTLIFIYYECNSLVNKYPNDYHSLLNFTLSPQ